jgi:carboxyl-terminal processing protease
MKREVASKDKEIKKIRKIKPYKPTFSTFDTAVIVVITCVMSLGFGYIIALRTTRGGMTASNSDDLKQIADVYNEIKENYYGDINDEQLVNGAIAGMMQSLGDPYSSYIGNSDSNSLDIKLDGSYTGVGIEVVNNKEGNIEIVRVFENSPASKAGMKPGDIILKLNDVDYTNKVSSELGKKIANYNNKELKFQIKRDNQIYNFNVKRSNIIIKSVDYKIYNEDNKKVGYIAVDVFSKVTYSQFSDALKQLEKENINCLIIDLRNNTGGYLTVAEDMISLFLNKDKVIYQIQKKASIKKYYSNGNDTKKYPIVLLVNETSASASELMTSALQEQLGATVIGKTTFGKGTVQELKKTDTNSEYKITTKKWLTSKGKWINGVGIKPDIEVDQNDQYFNSPTEENDTQLKKALEYVKNK